MVTSDITVAKDPGALKVSLAGLLFRLPLNPQKDKKLQLITSVIHVTEKMSDFCAFKTADGNGD